jgi:DNA polymerase-1
MYTIDFETLPIENGSDKTPIPVGVSIKIGNSPSVYYAWGHPTKNNASKEEAKAVLKSVLEVDELVIAHNAKFDLRICLEHFDLPLPKNIADTMIMAYLHNPREDSLGLKELADKYLGMPPDEQTELNNWLTSHRFKPGRDIAKAPGDIVGKYAIGDTDRTYELYRYYKTLLDTIPKRDGQGIWDAFNREMRLIPIVIGMEQRGLHLTPDIKTINTKWQGEFDLIELQLKAYGGGEEPGKKAFFTALANKGLIDKSKIEYTDKGNPRYGSEFLTKYISDDYLLGLMKRRSKLQKLIGTYVRPFMEKADKYNGKMYPYYNQTRGEDDYGTRSGRFSSNIQQLPKCALNVTKDYSSKADDLPNPRRLIVSKPGHSFVKRDFSGQELRVLAHYAEGTMLDAYTNDPKTDIHTFASDLIFKFTGNRLNRTFVKIMNFLCVYGGGAGALSRNLGIDIEAAKEMLALHKRALPEIGRLSSELTRISKSGKQIVTWGGRGYWVEEPKVISGKRQEWYYKLLNLLIQGSSADMTKEAMVRYYNHPDRRGDIAVQVHDEIVLEVLDEHIDNDMAILKWAMDDITGWDVPLLSDGEVGTNLYDMEKYYETK